MENNKIVISKSLHSKPYKTGYKYCLMVGKNNVVTMVWNYNAREYMGIKDIEGNDITYKYNADEIKKMYKNGEAVFYFYDNGIS